MIWYDIILYYIILYYIILYYIILLCYMTILYCYIILVYYYIILYYIILYYIILYYIILYYIILYYIILYYIILYHIILYYLRRERDRERNRRIAAERKGDDMMHARNAMKESESSTLGQKPAKLWKRQQRFAKSNKNERSACCRTTSTKFWHIPKLLRMHAVSVRAPVHLAKLWTATLWMKQTICRITRRRWSASHADIYSIGAVTRVTCSTTRSQTAVWFATLLRRSGLLKRRSTLLAWHWTSWWCCLRCDGRWMTWPARHKATVW